MTPGDREPGIWEGVELGRTIADAQEPSSRVVDEGSPESGELPEREYEEEEEMAVLGNE